MCLFAIKKYPEFLDCTGGLDSRVYYIDRYSSSIYVSYTLYCIVIMVSYIDYDNEYYYIYITNIMVSFLSRN